METKIVSIPRIERLMLDGLEKKLTLITAPAGYGKTAFVRLALQKIPEHVWINGSEIEFDPEIMSRNLDENPDCKIVVIDDYPESTNHPFHAKFEKMLLDPGEIRRFVITCRQVPPLPLARLRLNQLTEIFSEDLSLTTSEIGQFLTGTIGRQFDKSTLDCLHKKTTGWIACLLVWAQTVKNNQDIVPLLEQIDGLHPYFSSFIAEEIEPDLSDEEKTFLQIVSLHDWVNDLICDLFRNEFGTTGLPELLIQKNLLLIKISKYGLNPLIKEYFSRQVTFHTVDIVKKIHKSIQWYLDNQYFAEAINLSLKIQADTKAVEILKEFGHECLEKYHHEQIVDWVKQINNVRQNETPELSELYGLALVQSGAYDEALKYLESDNTPAALIALAGIARRQGRYDAVEEIAGSILDRDPQPGKEFSAQILYDLGLARMFTGKFSLAEKSLSRAAYEAEVKNNLDLLVMSKTALATIYQSKGNYDLAIDVLQQTLIIIGKHESESSVFLRFRFGQLFLDLGNLQKASFYIEEGLSIGRFLPPKEVLGNGHLISANIARLRRDYAKAIQEHYIAGMYTKGSQFFYEANLSARMLVYLATGEYGIVESWIEENGLKPEDAYYSGDECYLILARYFLHTGQTADAVLTIERLLANFQTAIDWQEGYLHILPWLALAYHMNKDFEKSRTVFRESLDRTAKEGHLQAFLDMYVSFPQQFSELEGYVADHPILSKIDLLHKQYNDQTGDQIKFRKEFSHLAQSKRIEIRTFGGLHVYYGGMEIGDQGWRTEKTRNLMAYFAVHYLKAVPVEVLLDDLWRDRSEQKSRRLLHTTLYYLKKALLRSAETFDLFNYQAGSYRINPEHFWIDLKEFDDLVKNPEDSSALNLAAELAEAGPCLYGIYDDWAIEAQNRYQVKLINLYQQIASWEEKAGSLEKAVYYARNIIDIDPLHEQAATRLMEWYIRLGNRTEAIRVFQKLEEQMMDELGVHPGESIQSIYRSILV